MKKKTLNGLLIVLLGYLLLAALRMLHLEWSDTGERRASGAMAPEESVQFELPSMMQDKGASYKNYATLAFQATPSQAAVEQKYEKIGSLHAETEDFDAAETLARNIIREQHALVQEEVTNSSKALRHLQLTIGVPPDNFDTVVKALKTVGQTTSFQVTKTDKTNDFLELKARRITLEKTRDALIALKAQGGKIDELVKLEQEILKLEDQIQGLGVQLGQFDKVNEFCTVRFSLAERLAVVSRSPHLGYLLASLEWAGWMYLAWLGIAAVGLLVVLLLLMLVEKSKLFRVEP